MDKNLKAELSALRNDFVSNLNKIEQLLEKLTEKQVFYIDTGDLGPEKAQEVVDKFKQEKKKEEPPYHYDPMGIDDDLISTNKSKDMDTKSILQMFYEASHWDEIANEIFVKLWNNTRKERIKTLEETLTLFAWDVKKNEPTKFDVKNIDEAKEALRDLEEFNDAKDSIIKIVKDTDRTVLNDIQNNELDDGFVRYYAWVQDIVSNIQKIGKPDEKCSTNDLVNSSIRLLHTMLEQQELNMFPYIFVDPVTFEFTNQDPAKVLKYQRGCLKLYNRELAQAYEFFNKKKNESSDVSMDDVKSSNISWDHNKQHQA